MRIQKILSVQYKLKNVQIKLLELQESTKKYSKEN